ncbi:CRE-SRA-33 protein [Caenorhabditis remanei]|uniref:CRE-SRA-33 protein n=1 Tax=Caenorhabditis remanei TaxID=31234 RepID=E3NG47_CAERE|nr:CRE-SRA-33 protein [Caenorhabditis remanei]
MNTYSDDVILSIRMSEVFRNSVYFINILFIISLVVTVWAILKLYKKQIFNASTTSLLISDIVFINIHNISYVFLQNWSLYRSIAFSHNISQIMFKSEECWPHHVINEYTKTVTLFIQFSLIINRISVTISTKIKFSKSIYGLILSITTLVASGVFTIQQHYRGPLRGLQTTSCFRESDVVLDLRTKTFNVQSEYMRKESIVSTIAVTIIGIIQLISFCFYDGMLTLFSKKSTPDYNDTNVIGWFYTGPFNAIISPSAVLVYIFWIRKSRKIDIKKLTKFKGDHFQNLSSFWI